MRPGFLNLSPVDTWGPVRVRSGSCPVYGAVLCGGLTSIPALRLPEASSNPLLLEDVKTQSISRHRPMSPEGGNGPKLRITALGN